MNKELKQEIIFKYGGSEKNTGKVEVQIALLSMRIEILTAHLKKFRKDNLSHRGLMLLVGKRQAFLKYLKREDSERYKKILEDLKLRR